MGRGVGGGIDIFLGVFVLFVFGFDRRCMRLGGLNSFFVVVCMCFGVLFIGGGCMCVGVFL